MICWDRRGEDVVGYFDEFEVEVLRGYAECLLRLLDHRVATYTSVGDSLIPSATTTDPRLAALLRAELGPDEPDWALACLEAGCFARVAIRVLEHLDTLPPSGGLVRLSSESLPRWLSVIHLYVVVIVAMTDYEGCVVGIPVGPTIEWLIDISSGLESLGAVDFTQSPNRTAW
ncbi:hypothetical protein ABZX92_29750 [Lentzea sp. NPDC006480]|uniref:DUF2017 family protein n=1 Tax=Lentzea sp. NPDC006480 TaxID=3157176 RepID=UPI0033B3ADF5